jgi:transcriptional regulator with XRE-family HTH domain
MNVGTLGSFIRDQRVSARLSLRKMSGLAGVSIPYLSQIERGLRKPSADILQAIAKGLRISAETLYVQAGMLEDRPGSDVAYAVMSDMSITESQKKALLQIYQAFREETGRTAASPEPVKAAPATSRKAASPTKRSPVPASRGSTPRAPTSRREV